MKQKMYSLPKVLLDNISNRLLPSHWSRRHLLWFSPILFAVYFSNKSISSIFIICCIINCYLTWIIKISRLQISWKCIMICNFKKNIMRNIKKINNLFLFLFKKIVQYHVIFFQKMWNLNIQCCKNAKSEWTML